MTPEETVDEFIRRIVSNDLDAALEMVSDDVEYDNVPIGKNIGPDEMRTFLSAMSGVDEVQFVVHRQTVTGNIVMNERSDRFRVGEQWMDLPVAGIFEVNDPGRITLWRDYFDLATFTDQMAKLAGLKGRHMPAVTADTLTLPKITSPGPDAVDRSVRSVTTAPAGMEGEGFPVRRAFAGVSAADLDPFIHMDQMGEVDYAPYEPRGTDWHPHRGFETVTYIIDGAFAHQDSNGGGGLITDGATQWMTAGGGILHIETPPEPLVVSGGVFHGVQLWVNLPSKDKMISPAYQNLEADLVTLLSSPDGGALLRLIAGDVDGHNGPGGTHTPIVVTHATISPGAQLIVPWTPAFNALAYVLSGEGSVGAEQRPVRDGQLVVFASGDSVTIDGGPGEPMEVLLLGGEPIREPVVQYGPFVMNTKAEIAQAVDDFNAGRLGRVPVGGLRPYRRSR